MTGSTSDPKNPGPPAGAGGDDPRPDAPKATPADGTPEPADTGADDAKAGEPQPDQPEPDQPEPEPDQPEPDQPEPDQSKDDDSEPHSAADTRAGGDARLEVDRATLLAAAKSPSLTGAPDGDAADPAAPEPARTPRAGGRLDRIGLGRIRLGRIRLGRIRLGSLLPTLGTLAAVAVLLVAIGYFAGLGPLNRLNTGRDIEPPDRVAGLERITDERTRSEMRLDATRDELRRINDGKTAVVEAYGDPGARMLVVMALRGRVDVDKEIRDSGARPDQVREVGKASCAPSVQDIPASCYRSSNTLTVIVQSLEESPDIDGLGGATNEAFDAMN